MAEAEDATRARKKAACFIMVVVVFSCVRLCGRGCWRGGGVKKDLVDLAWVGSWSFFAGVIGGIMACALSSRYYRSNIILITLINSQERAK